MLARAMQLYVLATCSALARADRHVLVMAHSADAWQPADTEPLLAARDTDTDTAKESLLAVAHSDTDNDTANQSLDLDAPEPDGFADHAEPAEEGSLEYSALDKWRAEAKGQVDGVVSEERGELELAATEGLSAAEEYAKMLNGLGKGFDTFRDAVGDFRAANKDTQGHQNEEVRGVLRSARAGSGATADATETPAESEAAAGQPLDEAVEAEHEEEVVAEAREPRASPLSESVVGSGTTAKVTETPVVGSGTTANVTETPVESGGHPLDIAGEREQDPLTESDVTETPVVGSGTTVNVTETPAESGAATGQPLDNAAEREEDVVPQEPHASPLSESVVGSRTNANATEKALEEEKVVEDVSHEAEKLTGHAENEATEEDAVESGSVVSKETSKEAQHAVGDLEQSLKSGDFTNVTHATEKAVENLVDEEEAQQARVTTACFAISDSPLRGSGRKCDSEVVQGIFEEKVCEGHGGDLRAACDATSKCQTKHVCLSDGAVVTDSDGAWEVNDEPSCEAGETATVCVPKAGSFRLPAAA